MSTYSQSYESVFIPKKNLKSVFVNKQSPFILIKISMIIIKFPWLLPTLFKSEKFNFL